MDSDSSQIFVFYLWYKYLTNCQAHPQLLRSFYSSKIIIFRDEIFFTQTSLINCQLRHSSRQVQLLLWMQGKKLNILKSILLNELDIALMMPNIFYLQWNNLQLTTLSLHWDTFLEFACLDNHCLAAAASCCFFILFLCLMTWTVMWSDLIKGDFKVK